MPVNAGKGSTRHCLMNGNRRELWPALESFLLTLWVGSLWSIGFIAAPVLFRVLDDRATAGTLAGTMFGVVAWLGMAAGGVLLVGSLLQKARLRWRSIVLLCMLLLVAIGHFVLQPMIAELRLTGLPEGSAAVRKFGQLHGTASVLYLLTSVLGLVLVVLNPWSRKG